MTADVVVVGLGAAGSAALYHLARRGMRVVGLDRFAPPHTMGSTHGGSRIIRKAYFEGTQYLPLLTRAYELWAALEEEVGQQLITRCGCLNIAPDGSDMIEGAHRSATAAGTEVALMTPEEVRATFPAFYLRDYEVALFEPNAGAIHPERGVAAHLNRAQAGSARVCFNEPVRSWDFVPGGVAVHTASRTLHAGKMVVTAGAWIGSLLKDDSPPVKVERVMNAWFATSGDAFSAERCPTFIWQHESAHSYGFPDLGHGIKAGMHYHGTLVDHPSEVDRTIRPSETHDLRALLLRLFPIGLGPNTHAATCLYTNAPDKHYLIDYLGGTEQRIVVGSACSGHGFKSSAAVGEALADLAMDRQPRTCIEAFQWRWP